MRARWSRTGSRSTAPAFPASPGTRPITARRIIAWLQHSSVVLQGAEFPFYRAFLKSLAVQIRFLRSMAPEMPDGKEKLRARIALAFAALSLPVPPSALRTATRNLSSEIERQILPDGGHISRNPMAVLELLADLLPLRQTYANQAEEPPEALIGAVERMLPALRFFRHQDGSLARFNGMGATIHDRIAAILRHDDTAGAPLLHAPHSGYERLSMGGTTVIADTGLPPHADVSGRAHAGCLSFEMSSGRHNFIVNSGVDTFGAPEFRPLARATAAHSTATLNDTSSARFNNSSGVNALIGAPLVSGAKHVACERQDSKDTQGFVAVHDGYVSRFGIYHERALSLSHGGDELTGIDRFFLVRRQAGTQQRPRLRRHPLPRASRDQPLHRQGGPAGADGQRHRRLGIQRVGRADGRGFDLLRGLERSAQVAADRARLQGFGSPGSALGDDPRRGSPPAAKPFDSATACGRAA